MKIFPILVCILLPLASLPGATASSQDDAGSGGDAPDERSDALIVPLGTLEGTLLRDEGDRADWYQVHVPAGQGFKWQMSATGDLNIEFYTLDGARIAGWSLWHWGNGWGHWSEKTFVPPSESLIIGVLEDWENVEYRLRVEAFALPALSVDALELNPLTPRLWDGRELPLGTGHDVHVTVANRGDVPTGATLTVTSQSGGAHRPRAVGSASMVLGPGESKSFVFTWDGLGQVGDATVRAVIAAQGLELDLSDNEASARSHVLVSGTGTGVDALNNGVDAAGRGGAWTYYGANGLGACGGAAYPVGVHCVTS